MEKVRAWREKVNIPTYEIGKPEKYPAFLEGRVYQASSGVVYPYPIIEQINDVKIDKTWDVIFIENRYIKLMVMPDLGGRIQMAYDKIKNRHFVYYNQVIKPALVGLTGPWISGGIEFNWPQHHRPTTYSPLDSKIVENDDGSVTVWVSEIERMFRTKGMAGFTLYDDKAYLEIKVQLYNRTPHPQSFLWWANPAVAVNDHYQSVFPPDVNAVFDHGKRDVSEFPVAKGKYYKVDYSPGTDISRYKNIPVPTSYMAISSDYDFVGGYENDSQCGMLHIADHHISPGKKQWTWGNGDFGKAWDRNLTDKDGPYIELMCGVYTDNQPDFAWLQPFEEKSFSQFFMPYSNLGLVKNANKNVLLNFEIIERRALLKIHVTSLYKNCKILVGSEEEILLDIETDLRPENTYERYIEIDSSEKNLFTSIYNKHGRLLISWEIPTNSEKEIPASAKAAKRPNEIETVENLYLCGLHLEQYSHATYDPLVYYKEAISREPGDVRCNNALGLWYLRKGKFELALKYFDTSIDTLTTHNPNPYDGEPFFNKGLTLSFLNQNEAAYKFLYKSAWNAAWQDSAYFKLAQLDCKTQDFDKAYKKINKSLSRNSNHHKAHHLKIILLRKMSRFRDANTFISHSLTIDNFNFGALFEKFLLSQNEVDLDCFKKMLRGDCHSYIEYAIDYADASFYDEAISLLSLYVNEYEDIYPMAVYFLGYFYNKSGNPDLAIDYYRQASKLNTEYCFPNRLEEILVLKDAIKMVANDFTAHYLLGNLWYGFRQYDEAQECWDKSLQLDDKNPVCHRNFALLCYNKRQQKEEARLHLEKAFKIDKTNPRLMMELDQLYKRLKIPPLDRLNFLQANKMLVEQRDDLYLEVVSLLTYLGEFKYALQLIQNRKFHPWEGGEGKVPYHYTTINIELAKECLENMQCEKSLQFLESSRKYPPNLGEGKLYGAQENDCFYWMGCTYEALNLMDKAEHYWDLASVGDSNPSEAIYYNDQQPDKIFYKGLALQKLGRKTEAKGCFEQLFNYGKAHLYDKKNLDYFAISYPDFSVWDDDLSLRNYIHCNYMIGLAEFGFNNTSNALHAFEEVLKNDLYHIPAKIHLQLLRKDLNLIC